MMDLTAPDLALLLLAIIAALTAAAVWGLVEHERSAERRRARSKAQQPGSRRRQP